MIAIPKPTRTKRRAANADYARLSLAKAVPDRDPDYLSYVRSQTCATWSTECCGVTEAAHLVVYGKGIKASDYLTVPLCTCCHRLQHQIGIVAFQIERGVNLWEVATRLLIRWVRQEIGGRA